jgi:hypothetical protein
LIAKCSDGLCFLPNCSEFERFQQMAEQRTSTVERSGGSVHSARMLIMELQLLSMIGGVKGVRRGGMGWCTPPRFPTTPLRFLSAIKKDKGDPYLFFKTLPQKTYTPPQLIGSTHAPGRSFRRDDDRNASKVELQGQGQDEELDQQGQSRRAACK